MKNLISLIKCNVVVFILLASQLCRAQSDTLRLTTQDAEKQFLQKNLALIAAKYNVDINTAAIKQAKLWDNPTFSVSTNIYDGSKYPFYHGTTNRGGEVDLQWSQLFKIGKQRKKLSDVLTDNAQLSEMQFSDLMNSLRYTLRNDLYDLAGLMENKKLFDNQLVAVQSLTKGMDAQLQAGNISAKDNIRMKALQYDLQSDILENEKSVGEKEAELHQLLQISEDTFIMPVLNVFAVPQVPHYEADSLFKIAQENRPDYKAAKIGVQLQQHNLSYQKSLAVPDLTIGVEYDHINSYAKNYTGLDLSLPLPLFNRNQVNVQVAKLGIQQQQAQVDVLESMIRNDIYKALEKVALAYQFSNNNESGFTGSYDALLTKMAESYRNKQINLIEFTDFLLSYKDTRQKMIDQHVGLEKSIEDLNYACGTKIMEN